MSKRVLAVVFACAVLVSCICTVLPMAMAEKTYDYELFQSYETEVEKANAAAVGAHVGVPDSAKITNRYVTASALSGSCSRELYWDGEVGAGADYLVKSAPASTLDNTTGIFIRFKTNSTAVTPFAALATADADGTISDWPTGAPMAKFYNLNGELVKTSNCICPAGFDGYIFLPTGDIAGKAVAAMLLATWYGNAYGGTTTTAWWSADPNGGRATLLFDDIGYYSAADDGDYAAIIEELESTPATSVKFETFQSYETETERANAAAVGSHIGVPDSAKVTNRYKTSDTLSGSYSRELYWDGGVGAGADYLVTSAPASTLDDTTGIFIRFKTTTESYTTLTLMATADTDGTISDWPNSATAMRYYNLNGELVMTNNCICPIGFDGYVFIPTGDIQGKAVAAMLMATWYGNAYGGVGNTTGWWAAGPDGSTPAILFDDIGYYYAPNGDAADYAALVEGLKAADSGSGEGGEGGGDDPNPNPSHAFVTFQGYETTADKSNAAAVGAHVGVPDSAMITNRYVTANTLSGSTSRELYWDGEAGSGADYLVMAAPASTLENTTGIYIRFKTNSTAVAPFAALPTADADGTISDWPTGAPMAKFYNLNGELVKTSNCICPAGFDGYIFLPTGDIQGKAVAVMLLATWYGNAYGGTTTTAWWDAGPDGGKASLLFDDIGYYYAPNGDNADYAALVADIKEAAASGSGSGGEGGGDDPNPNPNPNPNPGDPTYKYEIIQDYEGENTNGALWGHAGYVDGDANQTPITKDPDTEQTALIGNGSFFSQMTSGSSGSDHLIADAATMQSYSLENPTGIFFRLKTNRDADTTMYLSTIGAASGVHNWGGNNSANHSLMNWQYNNDCLNVRYFSVDGTEVTVVDTQKDQKDGRVIPANFDGYVFVPFDVDAKTLEGLTIMYAQSWALSGSYNGTISGWGGSAVVGFDNVGYYSVEKADDYAALVAKIVADNPENNVPAPGPGDDEAEAVPFQTYETEGERANAAPAGSHIGVPDSAMITNRYVTANALCGDYSRELYWDGEAGSGADYLVKTAPASTLDNTTGIYIRFKTNSTAVVPFAALSTTDTDGVISDWPNAAPMAKFYNLDGELVKTSNCVCPAGFNGYIFLPTGDIQGQAVAVMLLAKWYGDAYSGSSTTPGWAAGLDGSNASFLFDDIGYYYAPNGNDADYAALVADLKAGGSNPEQSPESASFQTYETEGERANAAPVGSHIGVPDSQRITNRYVTEYALSGDHSRELYWDGEAGSGADYLVMAAPASTLENTTGIYIRFKTNSTAVAPFAALPTADADGTISDWPTGAPMAKFYNLNGELVKTSNCICPAGFDGYIFLPTGDIQGQAVAVMLLAKWYGDAYSGSNTTPGWDAGPDGSKATFLFDDIGYYYAPNGNNADYAALVADLKAGNGSGSIPTPPPASSYGFEVIQNYEGENTNNGLWGHAGFVNDAINQTPITKDPIEAQTPLSGNGSFFSEMTRVESGSDYLIADAYTMKNYSLENPTGIFFRMKTNRDKDTSIWLTTIGASSALDTSSGAWCANNNQKYSLMNWSTNNDCLKARYFTLDGTDVTVEGDGRVVPANFDGYVFIPFNIATKSLEGLTVMYAPNWSLQGSYNGPIDHWYNEFPATVVGFDNIGYYSVSGPVTAADYADIIRRVENGEGYTANPNPNPPAINPGDPNAPAEGTGKDDPNSGTYEYQMITTYETEEEQANVGPHMYGESYFSQTSSIGGDYSLRVDNAAVDAMNVTLVTEAPKPTIDNANGLFFRFKANNAAGGDMCMSSGTPILGYDEWTGEFTVLWKDRHYGHMVFVWMDGTVQVSDSIVPANFDGYIFVMPSESFTTKYEKGILRGIRAIFPKWWAGFNWSGTTQIFDNVGYCNISDIENADIYRRLVKELNGKFPVGEGASGESIPLMRKYMTYESELEPSDKRDATYFQKPYLYFNTEMPIAVKWSVVSGEAELTYLEDPNDATLTKRGVMVTFGSTGQVVVRAELQGDNEQYAEFTFTVKKDASKLDDAIFELSMLMGLVDGEVYEMLDAVLGAAYAVLMDSNATQAQYNEQVQIIMQVIEDVENGTLFPDAPPADDPTGDEPTDGDQPTDGDEPTDGDLPTDGDEPTDGDLPTDGDEPTDGDLPTDSDQPTDGTPDIPGESSPSTGERSLVIPALILAAAAAATLFVLKRKELLSK